MSFRPAATHPQQYYTEMPMQISVTGGYHQVGSFMAELANMRRIVTVSGLHLKPSGKSDDGSTTSVEFTASAYSLNSTPAPDPNAKTAAPVKKEGAGNAHKSS